MMILMMMMIMMMKTQNGHNSANFQAMCSKFCMAIHPVSTYRLIIMILMILKMMMIMKMIMMMIMKMMIDQNGHISTNFQTKSSKFCMVPKCSIWVHLKCDKNIKRTPKIESLMCPKCRDIVPATSKKRAKLPSGRGRGRPRIN